MDGRQSLQIEMDRPIAKPSFPLPMIFIEGKQSECPTRRSVRERAYFFRRKTRQDSPPVYDFVIKTEPAERDKNN